MWLAVANCPKVNDESVLWLINNCANLNYLDVSGCNLRRPVEIIGSVLVKRGKITHLVMTETKLDIDTEENLKMESKSLTVIFKPGHQQHEELNSIELAPYRMHRANVPSNFQFY
ncbi:hypothetical protein BSL78_21325 [Apostichopus japonicus]|uniref:Uncharacterized protein n=1 Tax=Stichopus japonicus TaxID=307972 RepID=A0A2G8K1D6_STIJA|nr:hypothetical protein BSL78_21325 [Apostichopus japonicus]